MGAQGGLAWLALAGVTLWADSARAEEHSPREGDRWAVHVQTENDLFEVVGSHTDRFYTHGMNLSFLAPSTSTWGGPLARLGAATGFFSPDDQRRWGLEIGHSIYTPEDIRHTLPVLPDRPYAGWAYVGAMAISYSKSRLSALELQVGVVGDAAQADWLQNNWHDLIEAERAQGWANQLKDEVAFVLIGERRLRPQPVYGDTEQGGFGVDVTPYAAFAIGTVQTSMTVGGSARVGRGLDMDFGVPRPQTGTAGTAVLSHRPGAGRFDFYGFAGAEARAVAHDIFLDGNTFRDSARTDKELLVGQVYAGAVVRYRWVRFAYTFIARGREFEGQIGHAEFGSFSLTISPPRKAVPG